MISLRTGRPGHPGRRRSDAGQVCLAAREVKRKQPPTEDAQIIEDLVSRKLSIALISILTQIVTVRVPADSDSRHAHDNDHQAAPVHSASTHPSNECPLGVE